MAFEDRARHAIDALLEGVGWVLQEQDARDRNSAGGVAMHNLQLTQDEADDLLFDR